MELKVQTCTIVTAILLVLSLACGTTDESPLPVQARQSCASGETTATAEWLHFPDVACAEATRTAESSLNSFHYRKACLEAVGEGARPLRARVVRCGPASDTNPALDGSFLDVEICCDTDKKAVEIFEPRPLHCPEGRLQAMATDLHYPEKMSCEDAAQNAETSLDMAHYKRACRRGRAVGDGSTGAVLEARVVRCRPEPAGGFVLDVALCCSAAAPPGAAGTRPVGTMDIWEALRVGSLGEVERLLVGHPELANVRGSGGITLLHRANSLAVAEFLLSRRMDIDSRDENGQTPLHVAVAGGRREVVTFYMEHGADVDPEDHFGSRPLTLARTVELATLLLDNGADVNGGSAGTPLHSAGFYGKEEIARLLLERGAALEALDPNGETPLHRAAFRGHLGMVRLLLDLGAEAGAKNTAGRTPRDLVGEGPNRGPILDLLRSHVE